MFPRDNYANLIFISTIDRARTKTQISEAWGLSVSGGILYREDSNQELHKLIKNHLIEKNGDNLKAITNSSEFKSCLVEESKRKIHKTNNDTIQQLFVHVRDNVEQFVRFLNETPIKENVLSLNMIRQLYTLNEKPDKKEAKKMPMRVFSKVIEAYVVPYSQEMVKNTLKDKLGENMANNFKDIVKENLKTQIKEVEFNIEPLIESMHSEYNKNKYLFSPLDKDYKEITKNYLNRNFD